MRWTVLLGLLVVATGCRTSHARTIRIEVTQTPVRELTGKWLTRWDGVVVIVAFKQDGQRVSGLYALTPPPPPGVEAGGTFEGLLAGNELKGSWEEGRAPDRFDSSSAQRGTSSKGPGATARGPMMGVSGTALGRLIRGIDRSLYSAGQNTDQVDRDNCT